VVFVFLSGSEEVSRLTTDGESFSDILLRAYQEYLAALSLAQISPFANAFFVDELSLPHCREYLLLALGFINSYWPAYMLGEELSAFPDVDSIFREKVLSDKLPFISAIGQIKHISVPQIARRLTLDLLDAYSRKARADEITERQQTLEEALNSLRETSFAPVVEATLIEVLHNVGDEDRSRVLAVIQLCMKLDWYTLKITRALTQALPFDWASSDWSINRALIQAVKNHPAYFPVDDFPFRHALQQDEKLLEFVKKHGGLLRLVLLLFGGVLPLAKPEDLSKKPASVELLPEYIYRDAHISRMLLDCLHNNPEDQRLAKIEAELKDSWLNSTDNAERAEALLALTALGVSLDTIGDENGLRQKEIVEAVKPVADQVEGMLQSLYLGAAAGVKEDCLMDSPSVDAPVEVLRDLARFEKETTPIAHYTLIFFNEKGYTVDAPKIALYFAETIARCGQMADPEYSMAVSLDVLGPTLAQSAEVLVEGLAFLQEIYETSEWWRIEQFPSIFPTQHTGNMAEALNVIDGICAGFDCLRNWALEEIAAHLLATQPDVLPEALAICLRIRYAEFRLHAMQVLDPTIMDEEGKLYERVLRRVQTLKSPLHKSRSLWRLISQLPPGLAQSTLEEAITQAALIEDAQERSRMYWRLGNCLVDERRIKMYESAYQDALLIADPLNKARALMRLIGHFWTKRSTLLSAVLDAIDAIDVEKSRSALLQRVQPFLSYAPELRSHLVASVPAALTRLAGRGGSFYPSADLSPASRGGFLIFYYVCAPSDAP
jgi:hypothetical protein